MVRLKPQEKKEEIFRGKGVEQNILKVETKICEI